jgi:hypothetical protein
MMNAHAAAFAPLMLLFGCGGIVVLGLLAFWIWMLVDCLTKEPDTGNTKIIWVLVIIFAHWLGALIYLIARRPQRIREQGR